MNEGPAVSRFTIIGRRDPSHWDGLIVGFHGGREIGRLRYNLPQGPHSPNGIIRISGEMHVEQAHRRCGLASMLVDKLHEGFPGKRRLDPNGFTADGLALFRALHARRAYLDHWLTEGALAHLQ